jgi:histidinol dehydrogenase
MVYDFLKIEEPKKPEDIDTYAGESFEIPDRIEKTVDEILDEIRAKGDEAVIKYCDKLDNFKAKSIDDFRVNENEIKSAVLKVKKDFPRLVEALEISFENIKKYHTAQMKRDAGSWIIKPGKDKEVGQITLPIERVGIYIPGGRYIYPSSVLMTVVPALIAKVKEIVICSPPQTDGNLSEVLLYLCGKFGISEIYKIGGAQAIAVLAYGTQSIRRVDKIFGPGNIYVASAKKKVFGDVGIDSLAGPSEITVIADSSSNSSLIAADMIAQAEHDPDSRSILLTDSIKTARETIKNIYRHLNLLINEYGSKINMEVILKSLKKNCRIIYHKEEDWLAMICNMIAPEHLEIMTKDPKKLLGKIKNAGAIFIGEYSPVAVGDYIGGTNHVIPTKGNARFSSPLGVNDFLKRTSVTLYKEKALKKEAEFIETLSEFEKLLAHRHSVKFRFKK